MSEQEDQDGKIYGLQNPDGTLSAAETAYLKFSRPAEPEGEAFDPDSPEGLGWEDLGHSWKTDTGVVIHKSQLDKPIGDPSADVSYTVEQADPAQIMMMEKEIANLEAQLQAIEKYDPRTGAPIMKVRGEPRRQLEVHLHGRRTQLPYIRRMQEIAADWRKANVLTTEEKLQHQTDRQAAIYRAAAARADEMEVEALAKQMRTQRKTGGYQGA